MTDDTLYPRDQISDALSSVMLCLVLTEYNPSEMQYVLSFKGPAFADTTKTELDHVIRHRLWSPAFYERLTEMEFDTDDELYRHLQIVWNYCFAGGPEPLPV